jgi:hypothetical protein
MELAVYKPQESVVRTVFQLLRKFLIGFMQDDAWVPVRNFRRYLDGLIGSSSAKLVLPSYCGVYKNLCLGQEIPCVQLIGQSP